MDIYLHTLWRKVPSGTVQTKELAEVLELSMKQTSRHLKRWEQEGWLTFTSGRGRGNVSKLNWLRNVEEEFEAEVLERIEKEPVEVSSKYLLLDWSPERKQRLMEKFQTKFGYVHRDDEEDKLIIPRRYPFLSVHPLEAADVNSANLVATVYNRLVSVDETGNVTPELAHSYDVDRKRLRLYLKKDVLFHDGSTMTAEDVVWCLERMRKQPQFKDMWSPIEQIHSPFPLVVDIHYPDGNSYILQMIGMLNASIYKETGHRISGTGSFFIDENNEKKTTLIAFKDYFQERPLLDAVEFIQVPKDYDMAYTTASKREPEKTVQVESSSGFGVMIMNPHRNTDIARKEVRDYVHWVLAKHRDEIGEIHSRGIPNDTSCLSWRKGNYPVPVVERPEFSSPLVMMEVSYNETITQWAKSVFEKEGVPFEIRRVRFFDSLYSDIRHNEIDLFVHGEIFEMNEVFSYYVFLKNGYSPLVNILRLDDNLNRKVEAYNQTPFAQWKELHEQLEDALLRESIMIPLYSEKRRIPFSEDLQNIQLKHFGYVDFSKLWVRPEI
ncbi:ABC transporter substrate-binding protein [Chungangia koreensis]|uniref:ABC transporter substrate-binding protein n=1 Tax=Chungangia koreensis TaxID=752657 RepID=A0ABV8X628_9LACT